MSLVFPPSSNHQRESLLPTFRLEMSSSGTSSFVTIFIFMGVVLVLRTAAYPRCPSRSQTGDEVIRLRENCKYGVYEDNCSRIQCAKGPGEICGNANTMFRSSGQCGPGLRCGCGRCMGCSSLVFPLECFDKTCITPEDN